MGREIKRVPLDWDFPVGETWTGYLMPAELNLPHCPDCKNGYSPFAQYLHDLWYGYVPFDPRSTGSTPLRADTPAVRAFAERNINRTPEYYGAGEAAIVREAHRLTKLWNGMWSHHLSQADVDALVAGGRLMDFTHRIVPGSGWQKVEPPVTPTAAQVNEWSLGGFGHDAINAMVAVRARCEREGGVTACSTCGGSAELGTPEQRAAQEDWKPTEPPTGEAWQMWQTVSEGGPCSPVFASAEGLATWMTTKAEGNSRASSFEAAMRFIEAGWAPSMVATPQTGVISGVEYIGTKDGA